MAQEESLMPATPAENCSFDEVEWKCAAAIVCPTNRRTAAKTASFRKIHLPLRGFIGLMRFAPEATKLSFSAAIVKCEAFT
jgi:hypothetical protein